MKRRHGVGMIGVRHIDDREPAEVPACCDLRGDVEPVLVLPALVPPGIGEIEERDLYGVSWICESHHGCPGLGELESVLSSVAVNVRPAGGIPAGAVEIHVREERDVSTPLRGCRSGEKQQERDEYEANDSNCGMGRRTDAGEKHKSPFVWVALACLFSCLGEKREPISLPMEGQGRMTSANRIDALRAHRPSTQIHPL